MLIPAEVNAKVARREVFGVLDISGNNAGVSGDPLWKHTIVDWEWIIGVNL